MPDEDSEQPSVDAQAIILFILNGSEADVKLIRKALFLRQSTLATVRALEAEHSTYVGDRVMLRNLKPQYLNGMIGSIVDIGDGTFVVVLDEYPKGNRGRRLTIPSSCVTKL